MSRIGDKIRDVRTRKGMSQKQLAKKCGVSESFISEVEAGRKVVNEQLAKRISSILEVNLTEPLYMEGMDEEKKYEKHAAVIDDDKAPVQQWQSAFSSIIKDIPVYDIDMKKIVGYKYLPIIDRKVEGHNPEKLVFINIPDNTMAGFRIKKDDKVMVLLGNEMSNGFFLVEYGEKRAIRNIKMLGGGKVLVMSNDNGIKTDTRDIHELKILGRCLRVEIAL